jgi:hypothetical protein
MADRFFQPLKKTDFPLVIFQLSVVIANHAGDAFGLDLTDK